jgi:hypothetical protein
VAQETSQTPTSQSISASLDVPVVRLSSRALWATIALVAVTIAALWVAWRWPDHTLLHFWLVTQMVPLVYLFLAWWGGDVSPPHESDVV